jgi:prepilin-type N-terminal cleavage/methylation domain-containing protein
MTHSRISRPRRGFSLLELLVVLVVLAITAAAAVPAFLSDSRATPEHQAANAIADALMRTRNSARESGATATLVLSPIDGRYWITTRDSVATGIIPMTGTVRLLGTGGDRIECRFEASGPATPIVITAHGTSDATVRVDGWSGEIGVDDARRS